MVTCAPEGDKRTFGVLKFIFAPKGDGDGCPVTVSGSTLSKGRKPSPCTIVPLKCIVCEQDRWVWKYSMTNHVHTEHALPLAVSSDSNDSVFRAKCNVSE